MRQAVFTSAALLVSVLLSVARVEADGITGGTFEKGSKTFVCSNDVFLLKEPDRISKGKQLHIGDPVEIIEQSKKTDTVHEFEDHFYQVKNGSDSGFVWGGNLAKAHIRLNDSANSDLLLIKLDGAAHGDVGHTVVAELVRAGNVLSQCQFRAIESFDGKNYRYNIDLASFPQTLSGQPKLFRLNQNLEACDYACGDSIIALTGTTLRHEFDATSYVNEQGGTQYKFIGPSQKGGLKDKLIIVYTSSENESQRKTVRRETYQWNGQIFKKLSN